MNLKNELILSIALLTIAGLASGMRFLVASGMYFTNIQKSEQNPEEIVYTAEDNFGNEIEARQAMQPGQQDTYRATRKEITKRTVNGLDEFSTSLYEFEAPIARYYFEQINKQYMHQIPKA